MNQAFVIKCKTPAEKLAAASLAGTYEHKYNGGGDIHQLIREGSSETTVAMYPNVVVRLRGGKYFDFTTKGMGGPDTFDEGFDYYDWTEDLDTIIERFKGMKSDTMKISKDYNAVVSKLGGIQVGCQTISFEDFDKLAALVKKHR